MTSPLSGSLRTAIGSAMAFLFLDAVLTRDVPGTITDPADPPAPSTTTFTCKAIRDTWSVGHRAGGLVAAEDSKIVVLQTSLATTPVVGDRIEITEHGVTFVISDGGGSMSAVSADPANATWELRARTA